MNSVGKKVGKIVGCVLVGIVIALAFGWITMTLWNWLVPVLFNGPVITFWQSIGLLLLSKILFQGFGKGDIGEETDAGMATTIGRARFSINFHT